MKILMMTNTYTPVVGGVEESIKAFTGQFQREGHEVLIVAPEFANMPEHEENIIRIPAIQKFNRSDFSVNLPIPGLLSKLVNKFKPDIVHSHHPFLIGDMALRLCGQYDIPLVFTYHTMFEDYLHYLPFHNERIKRFVIELATGYANLTDHVIVPSQSVHNILSERGVDVPMSIIPTGIDIDRFSRGDGGRIRTKYGIPGNAFVIGHLGRLRTEKNLNFLSDAVAGFIKQNNNCHFLVIGGGPEETGIRRIFEKNGISECLHMTGVLQGQDVVDGYHAMNVFAFASHTETQGLVLTETLVSGIPVVALDAPGVREVVRDKKNGRLIPRQERNDFINALSWCYHCNEMQFDSLKIECRKIAGDFSIENCARKELDIYRSVSASNSMLSDQKHSAWSGIMHRIKTEWDMAKNFAEASEAAFHLQEGSEIKSRSAQLEKRHSTSRVIRWKRWLSRHEWAARLLNLKRSKATEAHNGLVLIQVDGFSRRQFQKALDTGEMPFLKRLLDSQHYKNYPLYTGLPSSTPSAQGELFYGVQQSVPAFAFYDGKCDRVFRMYDRLAVVEIEGRLNERTSNDKKGDASRLLSGGSSYSNVYSGGAGESHFCAVKIGWDMFWRGVNPLRITLLWITHILDFLWIIALMAAETIASVFDFTLGLCSGRNFWKELKFIPTRVFICVLLRELVIMGVKMDISRGHEIIHMNFLGYDEQAHRRGPSSVFAHKALRGIDNSIAKIYWHAFHSTRRNYDVWI